MWRELDLPPRDREIERPDSRHRNPVNLDPRDPPDRSDTRNVFTRGLDGPRGLAREQLHVRGRTYELRRSQLEALATIGAFRVVPVAELRDPAGRAARADRGDVYELRREGLVRTVTPTLHGQRTTLLTLTPRGRALLEAHRRPSDEIRQTFYAGPGRARELSHDAQLYRAYRQAADRLAGEGGIVLRVRLDHDLKREYQQFLQAANRGRPDSDGRPSRGADEIRAWAEAHDLPFFEGHVHFPDVRVEYELPDGRRDVEDLEVRTRHYRGAHALAKARAGFTPFDPDVAKEFV